MSSADEEVFDNEECDYIQSFIKHKDSTIWQTRLHDILNRGYSSGKLLDIGCNYGFFLGVCEPHFKTYGIDISRYAISEAKNYAPRSKIVCCDVEENIPFADETFDVVTMFDTLEHVKNYESTF